MSRPSVPRVAVLIASVLLLATPALAAPGGAERPEVVRCATPALRAAHGPAPGADLPDGARGALPCDHTRVGPPPNPQIGSSWDWYIWRLNGFPVADLKSCTIRGMGPNCYVVVEDSQWNVNIDQAQVDTIVDHVENQSIGSFPAQGIWELNTTHFGFPPDNLDQDPRVYILYYDFDVNSDGYFWAFDQQCDDVAAFHSNECDVVYMNCSDFDPAGSYLLAVVAHELEHLIHYNHDPNEDAWVDEGMAELAMWLYGDPDNISLFNGNPDRSLLTFSGAWADYIKVYLFSLYFYERYGGLPAVKALVAEAANGIAGFENVLDAFSHPEDFEDVFADWVVANWLDDPTIGDGRYGYVGETLPPFNAFFTGSSYPVGPFNGAVNHWAADYAEYLNGNALHTTFDGVDNAQFTVRAILTGAGAPTEILDMPLNAAQEGVLPLPQLGTTHEEAVLVYAGTSTTGGTGYQYFADEGVVGVPPMAPAAGFSLEVLGAASARPTLAYTVPAAAAGRAVRLDLHDVAGRLVARLADGEAAPGRHVVGPEAFGTLASGIYFARLAAGEESVTRRVVVRR